MNGLPAIANNLAAKGRYGDSMLVHMNPREVAGLQALAMAQGGSLSINPHTGLPEAFKLKDILPFVAGFALGPAGFALMPAWGAGLTVGGIEALRTGDLGRGLTAGLSAFSGAGLGSALTSQGSQLAAHEAGLKAIGATPESFAAGVTPEAAGQYAQAFQSAQPTTTSALTNLQMAGKGLANITQPGFMANLAQAFPSTGQQVAGAIGAANMIPPPKPPELPKQEETKYGGPYVPSQRSVAYKDPNDRSTSEFSYFNPFNPVPGFQPLTAASGGQLYASNPEAGQDDYALGGITALARGGGRFLSDPNGGDGTDDGIPAVIANKQPARLADGEFVIDARTVSELGNGSSKAGAQKLYAMMDRVHKARKKVGRGQDSRAEKYLPA